MKSLSFFLFTIFFAGCVSGPGPGGDPGAGVDVGNMRSASVPSTHAVMSYPKTWNDRSADGAVIVVSDQGSRVSVKRSEILELASPSAISLKNYLQARFPGRVYAPIQLHGLSGVRAELATIGNPGTAALDSRKRSDIYLVSELNDFIHIEADIGLHDPARDEGEAIVLSVRVVYLGQAIPGTAPKSVFLTRYSLPTDERMKAAYTFSEECYPYLYQDASGCKKRGVSVLFGNGGGNRIQVGNAGYDHGRIIDLGSQQEASFDSVRVDGQYLVAPLGNVPLGDIYTAFQPRAPKPEQDGIELKEGHTYLVRTISWPDEDAITKFRVDSILPGQGVNLTFQRLVAVAPSQLQAQVDAINQHTLESEAPLSEGEVTLYNRQVWNNYFYASFNFQYSTSGNMFITGNSWDLSYENGLNLSRTGSELAFINDAGPGVELDSLTAKNFQDPNAYVPSGQPVSPAQVGHVYLISHYNFDGNLILGAVKVLSVGPNQEWVRLRFRRVSITKVTDFQVWKPLKVPTGDRTVTLEKTSNYLTLTFYPFLDKRADEGQYHDESVSADLQPDGSFALETDSRPYGKMRGFAPLGSGTQLDQVTLAQVEGLRGQMTSRLPLAEGELVATFLVNYNDKTALVLRVDRIVPGVRVEFSIRYLDRAEAPYAAYFR